MKNKISKILFFIFLMCQPAKAGGAEKKIVLDGETFKLFEIESLNERITGKGDLSKGEQGELASAKEVVKKYLTLSPVKTYSLLSKRNKQGLKNVQVKSAEDYVVYRNRTDPHEVVWLEHAFRKVAISRNFIQITVVSQWSREGYVGSKTFVFDLIKENEVWKISFIATV